jgi:hypothetical protein
MRGCIPAVSLCYRGVTDSVGEPLGKWRWRVPDDHVDLRLHDRVALEEIELYADVLGAVAVADRPLTTDEIDEVLGLRPRASAEARVC